MARPPLAEPLWPRTAPAAIAASPLADHAACDVAVVGAGIMGLSLALHAAERGASVIVLEATGIGGGASGVNSGRVMPGLVRNSVEDVVSALGRRRGEALAALFAAGADEVFDLIRRHRIDCMAVRSGWISGAHARLSVRSLRRKLHEWQALGRELRWLDADAARGLTSSSFFGALLDPSAGHLNPLAYVRGLAGAAAAAGARVHVRSPVRRIERAGPRWQVSTPDGEVSADTVFLCVNGRAGDLAPAVHRSVLPLYIFEMATQPLPEEVRRRLLPEGHMVSDTRNAVFAYHIRPDGRLLTNALSFPQGRVRERVEREGRRHLSKRLGLPADLPIEHLWHGDASRALDSRPHLFEVDPGLFAPMACNGRGIVSCTVVGRLCAAFAAGEPEPVLAPEPPRPVPFHGLAAWLQGPVIALSALQDHLTP